MKALLIGILLGIGMYYLRIHMKGKMCSITNRIEGKHVLITGANTGLGLETSIELAKRGGIIHLACRNLEKCESARDIVLTKSGARDSDVVIHKLDLASIKSILSFVADFKTSVKALYALVNNAGIMMGPYSETADGFESQIGVNHLGHFLLTNELIDIVKNSHDGRIVIVSSGAHKFGSININDINLRGDDYSRISAYSQSKLANVIHAKVLAKNLKKSGIAVVSLHPGAVATDLQREWPVILQKIYSFFQFFIVKTPKEGAQTQICAVVDPNLIAKTGHYLNDCEIDLNVNAEADNESIVERLWQQSEQLIKQKRSILDL